VLPVLLIAAAVFFAAVYQQSYPVKDWLFWHYAIYWLACAFFSLGCVSSGYLVVRRLVRATHLVEKIALSFCTGVVIAYLAMSALGLLHALYWPVFFALPTVMIAAGARPLYRLARRASRHVRAARARARVARPALWTVLAWAFGLTVLAMIYFKILTPENVQFDARWRHLALAEEFAHVHSTPRYGEGWTVATNPHLAAMLYCWAFLLPGARLFDHVELAAHVEFTCLLWTLPGIVALVRKLTPARRAGASWAALFLFPGILLYDSALGGGADHIAALFAAPVAVCLIRALGDLSPKNLALLGIQLAGAAMPKLTGALLLVPAATIAIGAAVVVRLVRSRRLAWKGPLTGAGVALAATTFYWLKNWIWYGDPLYPSLHKYLHLHPWTRDANDLFVWGYKDFQFWRPPRSLHGMLEALKVLFTFSFVPHDYVSFHDHVPVFGSLFTLLLVTLPFFKRTRRIWGVVAMVEGGIFAWFWVHHEDRFLQALTPLMAAVVGALVLRVWQTHLANRVALGALIATQIVIGGDVYFIESHAMIHAPIKATNDLLDAGYRKQYTDRFDVFSNWTSVQKLLPDRAHVLLHDIHDHLGLNRRTSSDWGGWQFGISYGRLLTPRRVWGEYRELGVTHVVWQDKVSEGWDSVAGDLVFFDFALRHTLDQKRAGDMRVGRVPDEPPPDKVAGSVALFGCNDTYKSGLYGLSSLTTPVFGPKDRHFAPPAQAAAPGDELALVKKAAFVIIDPACAVRLEPEVILRGFELAAERKVINSGLSRRTPEWHLYLRR
jgi:hypothetical protein